MRGRPTFWRHAMLECTTAKLAGLTVADQTDYPEVIAGLRHQLHKGRLIQLGFNAHVLSRLDVDAGGNQLIGTVALVVVSMAALASLHWLLLVMALFTAVLMVLIPKLFE